LVNVLTEFKSWLRTVLLEEPPEAPKAKAKALVPAAKAEKPAESLRYSDLSLDDPAEALRALRRATRTPPHLRHLTHSTEESLTAYSVSVPSSRGQAEPRQRQTDPLLTGSLFYRPSQPEVRAVERQRRESNTSAPRPRDRDPTSATG
jgi:hypothetical protein